MSNKIEQAERLRTSFYKEEHRNHIIGYLEMHHSILIRSADNEPWELTSEEVEDILHETMPDLSAAVSTNVIVIFREKK